MGFLEKLAGKFLEEYGNNLHRVVFVFPTRRARLYFLRFLQLRKPGRTNLWAPSAFSNNDFIARLSKLKVSDPLDLVFELYAVYREQAGTFPKEFQAFYPWGKMIIDDFDEIDKYLIDPGELFRNLKEIKEVEDITKEEKSDIYNRYTGFWGELGVLYREFNRLLGKKGKAYEGMVYREVAERIKNGGNQEIPMGEKVIFCGFNAFTRAEKTIVKHFLDTGRAEIYWDMDRYFVEDPNQEAGYFFRENRDTFKSSRADQLQWVEDRLSEPRQINIIGVQSRVSQAKVLGIKLGELRDYLTDPASAAVVLPDEGMLFPVLNSLPEVVEQVNITIGYPLQQTPVFGLFDTLLSMPHPRGAGSLSEFPSSTPSSGNGTTTIKSFTGVQAPRRGEPIKMNRSVAAIRTAENSLSQIGHPCHGFFQKSPLVAEGPAARGANEGLFYYKYVRNLLNHPYIKPLATGEITKFLTTIKKENRIYLSEKDFDFSVGVLNRLFAVRRDSREVLDFFLELLDAVREFYRENKPDLFSVDYEYMYHFYTLVSRLKDSLDRAGLVLDIPTFRQLFTDIVRHTRTPFTGEPLMGLQIMGMLETQTLDFNHLLVLSVNEGHLPPGKGQQSFIPYDVRARMKLPTYKERDAIAAYHFYRLLKSSQNITLIYITETKGIEKSEKSRFIDQLLIEYAEKNPNARIRHQIIDFAFETQAVQPISVKKSVEILGILDKKSYSPSSLLTYLACSLKFYFTYVLKLREEEEMVESPDYRLIGEIVHQVLQELYQPYCGKDRPVTYREIESMKENLEGTLGKVFLEKVKTGDLRTGRNRIVYEVMKRFLDHFFEKEKQDCGFKILMLEQKISEVSFGFSLDGKEHRVKLEGTVDRLDVKDNLYRVIDYKTGKIGSLNVKSEEDFVMQLSGQEAVNRKEVFQLLFYRYLLKQVGREQGEYRLGIYPFKKIYDELKLVKVGKVEVIDGGLLERYEGVLAGIFRELFNLEKSFEQTGEEKNCQYCPYLSICNKRATAPY